VNYDLIAQSALEKREALIKAVRAEGRSLTEAEVREIEGLEAEASDAVQAEKREAEVRSLSERKPGLRAATTGGEERMRRDLAGLSGASSFTSGTEYREGQPLGAEQRFVDYVQARGLAPEEHRELNLGKYVRGMVTGEWQDADAERRAMSEGTATAGGHLVPSVLSAQVIDLARNKAVTVRAGATIFPMESRTLDIAKWAGDPQGGWRAENAAVAESDGLLDKVTFTAQTMAAIVRFSRELAEDADNLNVEVQNALSESFALKLDKVAMYGTGTAPEPRGLKNVTAVTKTPMATNGAAIADWDWAIDSVGRVRDANEEPNAIVYSPRSERAVGKLRATTDGQYLTVPPYLEGITRIVSNQIPNDLVVGTSGATTSDAFAGNWAQLLIGIRHNFSIEILNEKYADSGQIALLAWLRADVQVGRPAAFDVVTGIL
jgi:HK97 family phage major capsid protein